jgi:6-phosphogluconate dehydrogenase
VTASRILPGPDGSSGPAGRRAGESLIDDVRDALYASKVIAYAQGFDQIATASEEYGWDIDLGAMATIWRGGCIIRARFLDRIRGAWERDPQLRNLLLADYFRDAVARTQPAWRRVVATAVELGAHTYHRTDRPGTFHTRWPQDAREVRIDS